MTSIPPSSDLPNMHNHLGTKQDAQFLLTDATKQAIAQTGYHVEGSKGRGGFGATYEVKHQESGARAIAKVMLDPKDEHHLKAFQRECRVLASEHVPSDLVPGYITHVQRDGIQPFVLMESIDGTEIHKYVSHPHPLDLDRRIEIVEKLFRSYQRLHDCNIVHGDPSPRNTLVQSGDRIRFIDFGSACRLSQGFGTLGTVSLKGITPGYGDDDILINGKRPDRWTDLYAAAAIAFQVLTDQAPPADPSTWDRVLIETQVPEGVRSVILKARRKRDERAEIDPLVFKTVGEAADALHDWRAHRDAMVRDEEFRLRRRQQRRNHFLTSAVLLLIVGAIGALGWWKYDHERQLGDRRALDDLRRQVEPLANANHPGVARFISEATGEGVPVKRAIALLTQARAASRDIEWAESMRQSLGDVLNASPWLISAKAIRDRKDRLAQQFLALKDDLEAGRTEGLQPRFAELHAELAQLAHENTLAAPAEQTQAEYERLSRSVSERLRPLDGFVEIDRSAKETQRLLDEGKWRDAQLQFGSSTQRLNEWLKKNESPEELAARQKATMEIVASLEEDKQQLKSEVTRLSTERDAKQQTAVDLQAKLASIATEANADRTKRAQLETELASTKQKHSLAESQLASANGKIETLNADRTKLKQVEADFSMAKQKLDEAEGKLNQATERMKALEADSRALVAAREELQKLKPKLTSDEADTTQGRVGRFQKSIYDAPKNSDVKQIPASGDRTTGTKAGDRRVLKIKGVEFAFRWCPAGSFNMGAYSTQHDVTLTQGFWMLETEFTQGMWFAVMENRPWQGETKVKEGANYPATYVSWNDAVACCQKLTTEAQHVGLLAARESITLPTGAQWEYACRAGTSTAHSFGDADKQLGEYAWFIENSVDIGEPYAHQVGMKKPNPWGLSDMHGNVWEWCQDRFHNDYDKKIEKTDPLGPTTGTDRVSRGGSWSNGSYAKGLGSAVRSRDSPDHGNNLGGFRVVCVGVRTQ